MVAVKTSKRQGFTITELLVSISILGLLAALISPAVQTSRESARRMQCTNNLRQFGLALASVAESQGAFPTSQHPESAYRRMLPALEQAALYAELHVYDTTPDTSLPKLNVSQFVCPDDSLHPTGLGNTNYYFNDGTLFRVTLPSGNGFRKRSVHDTKPADISDGLSNTAAMSERLVSVPTFEAPSVSLSI